MKVFDMFDCEVPACAVDFSCLGALVQDGRKNALVESSFHQVTFYLGSYLSYWLIVNATTRKDDRWFAWGGRWRENWIENALRTILLAYKNGEERGQNRQRVQDTRKWKKGSNPRFNKVLFWHLRHDVSPIFSFEEQMLDWFLVCNNSHYKYYIVTSVQHSAVFPIVLANRTVNFKQEWGRSWSYSMDPIPPQS